MDAHLILPAFALAVQLGSVFFAFRLFRHAGKRTLAIVLLSIVSLMAIRRTISLIRFFLEGTIRVDLIAEATASIISCLILFAIIYITRLILSERANKDAAVSAEARYRTLFEQSPDGVLLIDAHGTIVDFNDQACLQLGYTREEFKNLQISDIDPVEAPGDIKARFEKVTREGRAEFEVRHKAKNGEVRDVQVITQTMRLSGQIVHHTIWRDITGPKRSEEALRAAVEDARDEKTKTEAMIDAMGDAINIQDANYKILYQNRVSKDIYGDHVGEYCHQAFQNRDQVCGGCHLTQAFADGGIHKAEQKRSTGEGVRYYEITASPLSDSAGKIIAGIEMIRDVTERKNAEWARSRSEKQFRALFDNTPLGIVIVAADRRIVHCNTAFQKMLGYTLEELKNMSVPDISHPGDDLATRGNYRAMMSGEIDSFTMEKRYFRKDGTTLWTNLTGTMMRGEKDGDQVIFGIIEDISERKREEEKLQKSERQLRESQRVAQLGSWDLDLVTASLEWSDETYRLFDKSPENFVPSFDEFARLVHPEDRETMQTNFDRALASDTYPYHAAVRIINDSGRQWVMEAFGAVRRDVNGKPLSIVGTAQDITERKQAEEALQKSEHKFRGLFESANDALFILDLEGNFIDINRNGYERLGYTKDEILSMHVSQLDPPEYAAKVGSRVEQVIKDGHGVFESVHCRKDGTPMPVEINVRSMDFGDRKVLYSIVRDITERKQTETALKETNAKLQTLIWALPDAVYFKDTDRRYLMVNRSFESLMGLNQEMVFGKTDEDFMPPALAESCRKSDEALMKGGTPVNVENTIGGNEGENVYLDSVKAPIYDSQGALVGIVGVSRDITERKRAAEALRQSEAQLRAIFEHTAVGIAIATLDRKVSRANPALGRFLGYDTYELQGMDAASYSYPDDDKANNQLYREMMAGGRDHYEMEKRYVRKNGEIVWGQLIVSIIRDAERKPEFAVAMVEDISARKKAEAVLHQAHEDLEAQVRERTAKLTVLTEQLRNFSSYLQEARERERTTIAREIHDELGQALTALKLDFAWVKKEIPRDRKKLSEKVASMTDLLTTTMETVKRVATQLRPGILDHLGLTAAMEWQAGEFSKRTGIPCDIIFEPDDLHVDRDRSTTLFRIFQETLTNIARHAKATAVNARLNKESGDLVLYVSDNGSGITEEQAADSKSLGLIGIRERVYAWGGTVTIRGAKNSGTAITVRIPLAATEKMS